MRRIFLPVAIALACGLPAAAQQTPAPKSDISVEARLVVLPAVVRDKKGALLNTLKKDSFALSIDGKPQAIRYFDHDTEVPLTVGLLIDTSGSMRKVLDGERTASFAFLDKMLAPERDKAFIIQFGRTIELLQDVTSSRPMLQKALKEVDADTSQPSFSQPDDRGSDSGGNTSGDNNSGGRRGGGGQGRGGYGGRGGGTALYDAVFLASDEVLAKQKGRSAIILLTDGDDRGSKTSLAHAIESAQHANTIVYAIYYKGEHDGGGGDRHGGSGRGGGPFGGMGGGRRGGFPMNFAQPGGGRGGSQIDGRKVLERICGETGGRVFEVTKKDTVDVIYTQIAEELRTQYRLGFTPTADAAAEGYHQIALTLTGAEAKNKTTIQTRDGYYTEARK